MSKMASSPTPIPSRLPLTPSHIERTYCTHRKMFSSDVIKICDTRPLPKCHCKTHFMAKEVTVLFTFSILNDISCKIIITSNTFFQSANAVLSMELYEYINPKTTLSVLTTVHSCFLVVYAVGT